MKLSPPRTWSALLAVVAGFTVVGSAVFAQEGANSKNLIVNGSFEKGMEGWTFDPNGKKGVAAMDENEKHLNKPSLRIDNAQPDDSHIKQKVTVEPETRYRLEAYIKTKDVLPAKRDSKGGACIDLEGTWQTSQKVNKTHSWTKVTHDIVTGSETEVEVGGRLGFWSDACTGTAWFANFTLVKIGKAPPRK